MTKVTDVQPPSPRQPSRIRKAWCEMTGGHFYRLNEAGSKPTGTFAVRVYCERCAMESRWMPLRYQRPQPQEENDALR